MPANLSDAQFSRLRILFADALTLSDGERDRFVRESTDGDELLTRELSSLLRAHEWSESYFNKMSQDLLEPVLAAIGSDEDSDEKLGTISRYELIERTGGGGMGVVYKARDTQLGRLVALKFLPRHHASNPSARARFVAEARAASRLDHPNIGTVYEIGETEDGKQFIAMAWYDGETLKERARRERVSVSYAVSVARQLSSALSAAHRAGIIHRDVKPANVIVTISGTAKLVDFGIAKLTSEDDGQGHAIAGTLGYMSPEQTADTPLDARTDVWSLGVLLYETLAGHRPFRGETDRDVVEAIRAGHPASIQAIRHDVPRAVAAVIEKCLEKNPDRRYASADALKEALDNLDVVESETVAPTRRTFFVAAGVVTVALVAVAGWTYWSSIRAGRGSLSPASPMVVTVLPFATVGEDAADYLGVSLAEDFRGELGRNPSIVVPSALGSEEYAATKKSMPQIAGETGAKFVIAGTVSSRRNSNQLSLRLIDGSSGKERWSGNYVAADSASADIVRQASNAILLRLGDKRARIDSLKPRFRNLRAYDFYLRGRFEELGALARNANGRTSADRIRSAQAYYSQSRVIQPLFAALRARLAATHVASAQLFDTTISRRDQARLEAEAAIRADPQLWDAHKALGEYWQLSRDPEQSARVLEGAVKSAPNNVPLLLAMGSTNRSAGRLDDAVTYFDRATSLDPHNPVAAWMAATTYGRLRKYADAMKHQNRITAIWPHDYEVKLIKGHVFFRSTGSVDTLTSEASRIPREWDVRGMKTYAQYVAARVHRRPREGLSILDGSRSELSTDGLIYQPRSLMRAELYHDLGDFRRARQHYEIARREMEDSARAKSDNPTILVPLALAYASLGRRSNALSTVAKAIGKGRQDAAPVSSAIQGSAVEVYARLGDLDQAFETIELMLTMSSGRDVSLPLIRAWPAFDPLRKDPRYDQIMRRFGAR